jgi:(2Fe-2S) ferredoxin
MSHFKHHVFFCTNQRSDGRNCCENFNATAMRAYAKQRCKTLGLSISGQVRINTAGCLDRCDQGPVMVVYPEAIWYNYIDQSDIDEIVEQHLSNGMIVERLNIDKPRI